MRFTEAIHLSASVNRFRAGLVKGFRAGRAKGLPRPGVPLGSELPLGSCHGVASWHGGRDN
jgi:hypothetical protein